MTEVAVVMGVKNGGRSLERAVRSLLEQGDVDLTVHIMNDGSTDETADILHTLATSESRLIVSEQENRGLGASLNTLIDTIDCPLVARMDADDVSLPWRLRSQVDYMACHTNVGMAGTWTAFRDRGGRIGGCQCFPDDHDWLVGQLAAGRNVFVHSSVIMRRSVLADLEGPYRFRLVQDFDLWLRLSQVTRLGMVERVGVMSNWHGERVSTRSLTVRRRLHEAILELHRQRCRTGCEPVAAADVEREAFYVESTTGRVEMGNRWFDAMSAVYRRDFGQARTLFAEEAAAGGPLARKARRWRLALTLPFAHRWLPILFSPLRYMRDVESIMDPDDLHELDALLDALARDDRLRQGGRHDA